MFSQIALLLLHGAGDSIKMKKWS